MEEEDLLSPEVTKNAYRARNGELAWKKEDIPVVLDELSKLHLAVLGGEIWGIHGGKIWGMLPMKEGVPAVYSWSVESEDNETWEQYMERSIRESLAAINDSKMEEQVQDFLQDKLYFNLSICNQENYRELEEKYGI